MSGKAAGDSVAERCISIANILPPENIFLVEKFHPLHPCGIIEELDGPFHQVNIVPIFLDIVCV